MHSATSYLFITIPILIYPRPLHPSIPLDYLDNLICLRFIALLVTEVICRSCHKINLNRTVRIFPWFIQLFDSSILLFCNFLEHRWDFKTIFTVILAFIGFHLSITSFTFLWYLFMVPQKMDEKPEEWIKMKVLKIREVLPNLRHKLMSWKNRKMLDDPMATCCVCLGPKGEVLRTFIPCGHTYFCTECVDRISYGPDPRCPYCREPITSTMRIRI